MVRKKYKVTERDGKEVFYRKLTNLCEDYNLKYEEVRYKVSKRKKPYIGEFLKVDFFYFKDEKVKKSKETN